MKLTSFMPSSLPRLLVPRSGGKAASCHPPPLLPPLHNCSNACSEELSPRALLLLLRLSSRCLALDFLTGAAGSSSGSLCTSQRDGDLKRRRGLVGEVTGEVSLCTRVPNMVIIRPRSRRFTRRPTSGEESRRSEFPRARAGWLAGRPLIVTHRYDDVSSSATPRAVPASSFAHARARARECITVTLEYGTRNPQVVLPASRRFYRERYVCATKCIRSQGAQTIYAYDRKIRTKSRDASGENDGG